jgi:SAM-dependent methyltransferase
MIRLDPPGTFCQIAAVWDLLDRDARTFADVGCGTGSTSRELCRRGLNGLGVDLSSEAVEIARETLAPYIAEGRYRVVHGTASEVVSAPPVDAAVSMMVAEHMPDDLAFVRSVAALVRPGGQVIIGVPGRRDRWGYEDDVVGHLRRYERDDLQRLLLAAGLEDVKVWSVAVPVANLLFHAGNRLVRRGTPAEVASQAGQEQTESSGIREIPWKTVFPRWCALLLNRYTLAPLIVLQRLFYRSSLGITLAGSGRVPRR